MAESEKLKGCHYQEFDPRTLAPTNEATRVRLRESSLLELDFRNQSVLDIGCNLGLFSLVAARGGASRVLGIDITERFVLQSIENSRTFFRSFEHSGAQNGSNVSYHHVGFTKLLPETYRSDIVLCFEVLHWLTAQGVSLESSISRLKKLTGQILVLEFPWDVSERSIIQQTTLTPDEYDAELVFRELLKHFSQVRVVRFTTYMGDKSAKRVLVHAR